MQLINNTVLVSAVQQGDAVIHMCIFFFIFLPTMVYHRIGNIVPFVIQ